ncbi:MAG: hypothetical protein QTN59_20965 [Candidatus Electrothrix communis]|nr:MAG: hypothetical protein QTN59_20965 [Candidatus Electrothrix communis]
MEAGKSVTEIFEGPLLTKGFLDEQELEKAVRRTELRTSDLIRLFMDIKGVLAVHNLSFIKPENDEKKEREEEWLLKLDSSSFPRLHKDSDIKLIQDGHEIALSALNKPSYSPPLPGVDKLPVPEGHDRHIATYSSIQHQFPNCYGIGSSGLPASATSLRKAQMKQLKAYLTLFDQLLVNQFTQLANAGQLFSFLDEPDEDEGQIDTATYFTQTLNESELGLDDEKEKSNGLGLWTIADKEKRSIRLKELFTGSETDELERKNRFLDHLLARFGEQVTDYPPSRKPEDAKKQIKRKQYYLRFYAELSKNRAVSYCKPADADHRTGLERRIRLKLSLDDEAYFYLVEHILLRPVEKDKQQRTAILELIPDIPQGDPYSLRVSVVLSKDIYSRHLQQSILEEIPAHLIVNFLLMDEKNQENFKTAYKSWREFMSNDVSTNHQKLRAARDRLIDLLDFGRTYPLSDLSVPETSVAFGKNASIDISNGQQDVLYQLYQFQTPNDFKPVGDPVSRRGDKTTLIISSVTGTETHLTYRIKAWKKDDSNKYVFLDQEAIVRVEVNLNLTVKIVKKIDTHGNITPLSETDEPVLIQSGHKVIVQINGSQAGVLYGLFSEKNTSQPISKPETPGVSGQNIEIESYPIDKDIDIHIEAKQESNGDSQWLRTKLPLRVRARTDLAVSSSIIEFNQSDLIITLNETQENVFYQAFQRPLRYNDFVFEEWDGSRPKIPVHDFSGIQFPDVQVNQPKPLPIWEEEGILINYIPTPAGADEVQGHSQKLELPIDSLKEDSLIIFRAAKKHKKGLLTEDGGEKIRSEVQLSNAVVLLVKPDHHRDLFVKLRKDGEAHFLQVANGQPGVFYHFRLQKDGDEICQPAYFHKWKSEEYPENIGIGRLRIGGKDIGGDFVVAPEEKPKALVIQLDKQLSSQELDNNYLYIQARKARTNVWIDLERKKLSAITEPPI